MATGIKLPKLGETMEEGLISSWLVQEGERVERGQPLFEVQTDKVNIEYESPAEGHLLKILVPAGQTVPVLTVVGYLGAPGEELPAETGPAAGSAEAIPAVTPPAGEERSPAPAAEEAEHVFVSPRARRLAREAGLDPSSLAGSGPRGRVLAKDIESRLARSEETAGAVPAGPPDGDQRVPMTRKRRAIARRMTVSFAQIPHFYLKAAADVTDLLALRASLKGDERLPAGGDVSLTSLIVRACALALREFPALNASVDREEVVYHTHVNIGVAVALDDGLIVPVIRDADRLSFFELARVSGDLAARARAGRLALDEYGGGTFTISNLGMFGVDEFTAIINPPEVAILAVGRAGPQVVPFGTGFAVRHLMRLTLSCDHRLVDGAVGARFLAEVRGLLEAPYRLVP